MSESPRGLTAAILRLAETNPPYQKKVEMLDTLYQVLFEDKPGFAVYGKLLKKTGGSLVDAANILFYVAAQTPLTGRPSYRVLSVADLRAKRLGSEQEQRSDDARAAIQNQIDVLEPLVAANPRLQDQVDELRRRMEALP